MLPVTPSDIELLAKSLARTQELSRLMTGCEMHPAISEFNDDIAALCGAFIWASCQETTIEVREAQRAIVEMLFMLGYRAGEAYTKAIPTDLRD